MHEYMTRHMVALKPMTYAQMDLAPGDPFRATPVDGDYFCRNGRAKDTQAAPAPWAAEDATETLPGPPMRADPGEQAPAEASAQAPDQDAADDPQPRRRGRPSNASRTAQNGGSVETMGAGDA